MIKIRIGPSDFDLAEVLENPGRYTTQLERARMNADRRRRMTSFGRGACSVQPHSANP